jgi:PGF-pre-PGF domain-containing protein
MNKKCIPIIVIAIILISGVAAAVDQRLPLIPAGYYGSITINGQPASQGIKINAMMGGEGRGDITTTSSGSYGGPGGSSPKLGVRGYQDENGSTVTFYVSGVAAKETIQWISGDVREVDLTFVGVPTGGNNGNPGSSGNGDTGGGGGGGGTSGENASNIELIEKYDMQISKDALTSYRFTHPKNPIMFVNITGNTSPGIITVSIEVLKNTSTLVNAPPDGLVYKNSNIWVGTAGFATPKNIKEALIKFRIDNAWMSANGVLASDIVLMKWDGTNWIKLETKVLLKDGTNSYFEGWTNAFSPFAIVAKTAPKPMVTSTPAGTPAITATGTPAPPVKPPMSWNWVLYLLVVIIIGAAAYLYIIKKK